MLEDHGETRTPPARAADGVQPGQDTVDPLCRSTHWGQLTGIVSIYITHNDTAESEYRIHLQNKTKKLLIFGKNSVLFTRPGLKSIMSYIAVIYSLWILQPAEAYLKRYYHRLRGGSLALRPQRKYPIKYIDLKTKTKTKEQERWGSHGKSASWRTSSHSGEEMKEFGSDTTYR